MFRFFVPALAVLAHAGSCAHVPEMGETGRAASEVAAPVSRAATSTAERAAVAATHAVVAVDDVLLEGAAAVSSLPVPPPPSDDDPPLVLTPPDMLSCGEARDCPPEGADEGPPPPDPLPR